MSLLTPDATSTNISDITEKFLHHDKDLVDCHSEASTISMSEHVSECITAGLTSTTGMTNDLESIDDDDITSIPVPLITGSTAVLFLPDLTLYFQSLSVSSLPAVPGSSSDINISDLVTSLSHAQRSLAQHLDAHKTQSQLDSWLQRSS